MSQLSGDFSSSETVSNLATGRLQVSRTCSVRGEVRGVESSCKNMRCSESAITLRADDLREDALWRRKTMRGNKHTRGRK